jgi:hypothetical protein
VKVENFMLRNVTLETRVHRRLVGEELIAMFAVMIAMTGALVITFGTSLTGHIKFFGLLSNDFASSVTFVSTTLTFLLIELAVYNRVTR